MKNIEVAVSPDAEEFYLAFEKGWTKLIGHSIVVGDFRFSAVPVQNFIRVSEVDSGAKLFDLPVPDGVESHGETMFFLELFVASRIVMLIEKAGIEKTKEQINLMKQVAFNKHGKKPIGQKVNTEWIKEGISDQLH